MGSAQAELSQRASPCTLLSACNDLQAALASRGCLGTGRIVSPSACGRNGRKRGNNGTAQVNQSDGMGMQDELH